MRFFKYISLFLLVFIVGFIVFDNTKAYAAFDPYRPLCLGIQGKFYANQTWKGGYIEVGCGGDNGGAVNQDESRWCKGEIQRVKPGDPFRLTKCSCFGSDEKGCLKIGKDLDFTARDSKGNRYIKVLQYIQDTPAFKNNSCQAKLNGEVITKAGSNKLCGKNTDRLTANIKISCEVPETTNTPTPTQPITTGTPTPTTPNQCPKPEVVPNVRVTCPTCFNSNVSTPIPTVEQQSN